MSNFRVGMGYDVHRLVAGRPLVLGGVSIPFDKGLLGHSDGDALAHAFIDALLGASNLGDIGLLFPSTDDRYKNARSLCLLTQAYDSVLDSGWEVANLDATIIAEQPRLTPYLGSIRDTIAKALELRPNMVGVKGKTNDHLGFLGEGLGIAVWSVALLQRRR
jgi:2-C-methyl-D-erythritol 2,4-cyclodiphosphate synthase